MNVIKSPLNINRHTHPVFHSPGQMLAGRCSQGGSLAMVIFWLHPEGCQDSAASQHKKSLPVGRMDYAYNEAPPHTVFRNI